MNIWGEVTYKGALVGQDGTYGGAALATAAVETRAEASTAIAAMPA